LEFNEDFIENIKKFTVVSRRIRTRSLHMLPQSLGTVKKNKRKQQVAII